MPVLRNRVAVPPRVRQQRVEERSPVAEMNRWARWMVNRRTEARARRVLRTVGSRAVLGPTSEVLELGSGGGGLLALLEERYHPGRLVGTDYDPEQVAGAEQFLVQRWGKLPPSVTLRRADAAALEFPSGSFDVVFAMMMLHHVEERHTDYVRRPRALSEIRRVLRPGGRLIYSEIFRRREIRSTLAELGFTQEFLRSGWRSETGVYRAPPSDRGASP